jgi:hypothetical protein
VKHDEITRMVTGSSADDWTVLGHGPTFLDRFGAVISGTDYRLEADPHYYLAVYKADVSLRLAWGIQVDDKLEIDGWIWPDRSITRHLVDAFWQGALVARWTVLLVDGARCYLPDPDRAYVRTDDSIQGFETVGTTAKQSEVGVARLLHTIVHPGGGAEFDRYLEQAGAVAVPDE